MTTFGQIIVEKRKEAGLSQKELAALIIKEDGQSISPQYLNDIERDRRNAPSEHLIRQFAAALNIQSDYLFHYSGELPTDVKEIEATEQQVVAAYKAYRKVLKEG